ncbi:MAG: CAP domain-containing protein [bacterium]
MWLRMLLLGCVLSIFATLVTGCDPSSLAFFAPLVLPKGDPDGKPYVGSRNVDQIRIEMLSFINTARDDKGLAPLGATNQLNSIAQLHSNDMVENDFVGHTGSDGSTVDQRVGRYLTKPSFLGENVGAGFAEIEEAFDAFMEHTESRENILSKQARQVGMGFAFSDDNNKLKDTVYVTMIFYTAE